MCAASHFLLFSLSFIAAAFSRYTLYIHRLQPYFSSANCEWWYNCYFSFASFNGSTFIPSTQFTYCVIPSFYQHCCCLCTWSDFVATWPCSHTSPFLLITFWLCALIQQCYHDCRHLRCVPTSDPHYSCHCHSFLFACNIFYVLYLQLSYFDSISVLRMFILSHLNSHEHT